MEAAAAAALNYARAATGKRPMFLWKLISALLDFDFQVRHWRSNLGFWGGIALAVLAVVVIPWPHIRAMFAVALFLAGLIGGLIWDIRSGA